MARRALPSPHAQRWMKPSSLSKQSSKNKTRLQRGVAQMASLEFKVTIGAPTIATATALAHQLQEEMDRFFADEMATRRNCVMFIHANVASEADLDPQQFVGQESLAQGR